MKNTILVPYGTEIVGVKEVAGMKFVHYKGTLTIPPDFNWMPILSIILSGISFGLSLWGLLQ